MKLYHVSYDAVSVFIPRVPRTLLSCEDAVTPRICFASSVENCINAKPAQAHPLKIAMEYGIPVGIYVYQIDTADVPVNGLIEPSALCNQYGVADAALNHEYWLLHPPTHCIESRYEVIDVSFDTPSERYARARQITLWEGRSKISSLLEQITSHYNKNHHGSLTTDQVICELGPSIVAFIRERKAEHK